MKVTDFLAKKIKALKINNIPVFQGGAIMHLIDSIGELKGLNYYVPYHEQSMAMSADGYSRIKGMGVGCVTSGPGGTNLITGVCCSYYDSIPCLFFTGQVGQFHIKRSKEMRQRGFQETDMVSLFSSITKFAYQIKNPNEVGYIFDKAVYLAKKGRPGPVVIDLPYNIQIADINLKKIKKFFPPKENNKNLKLQFQIKKIIKLLNQI
jgi:acetolactate synthase-1/2/3 large subunit